MLEQLCKLVFVSIENEKELVFDFGYFYCLEVVFLEIGDVFVQLKKGEYDNEFIKYCYDVVIQVGKCKVFFLVLCKDWIQDNFILVDLKLLVDNYVQGEFRIIFIFNSWL